jgi:RNA polymerase sigma factor (sigma-70 family)
LRSQDIKTGRIDTESLIQNFSRYIFSRIGKFRYFKYGLERDDLLQDIYIKIWRYYEKNDKDIPISRSYIDTIINSVLINSIKKSRNEIKALNRLKFDIQEISVRENTAQLDILKEVILNSLNEIKPPSKIVISLYLTGFTLAEVAKIKGWGQSKTNNLYYRGIEEIKKKLKANGIYYED